MNMLRKLANAICSVFRKEFWNDTFPARYHDECFMCQEDTKGACRSCPYADQYGSLNHLNPQKGIQYVSCR